MDCVSKKKNENVAISIIKAEKEQGSNDIEFILRKPEAGEWVNQIINFEQLKNEIIHKGKEYIKKILLNNKKNILIDKIKYEFDEIS